MYYGQPSGMMWPGMDGKIHSDADVNALTDGTKIIFGDDSDKDGEYPYGTFKATHDAKAASDAEAYAPFDVHGDIKGGDNYGKDGKQGMIVVGGADADVNALTDGTKIIFGDDSDKDGVYPYGTFKATGDAKAASDAEAYAPFDVH